MDIDESRPGEGLEERVARLEARISRLEARLSPGAAPIDPQASTVSPVVATPQPVPQPGTSVRTTAAVPSGWGGASQAPAAPVGPRVAASMKEVEERLAGRALAVVGGVALVLGAIFFLSLAFSRGWIGPELRVLIGLTFGSACVAGGAAFLERKNRLLGHVLTPVGLAIISISLIGATRLYDIVPTEVGLLGALLSAAIVAIVAVRNDSQLVAAFGLISVLVAPPLLGAAPDASTLAFVGAVLIGTTSIAVWRSWQWLPPIAFVLTVPQFATWIGSEPPVGLALFGLAAFWALNIVAAGGEEFRRHRDELSPSSATLLLGNAAFVVWSGFMILAGDLEAYRGLFVLAVAAAHLVVGGYFLARDGERNLFALLAVGTGIAALTMAMPNQLGAPAVPIAWTAEAVALAWVAVRRGHPYSALVSAILYLLAALAVVVLYPAGQAEPVGFPFLDARAGALAFFVAGITLGIWLVRDRGLRSALAVLGLAVAVYCAGMALSGVSFVAAAAGLMVVAAVTIWALPRLPNDPIEWMLEGLVPAGLRDVGRGARLELALPIMLIVLGALAALHLVAVELPIIEIGDVPLPPIPFTDAGSIGAAILIGGALASAWIIGHVTARRAAALAAGGIIAYVIPFQVEPWAVAVLWAFIGVGALQLANRDSAGRRVFETAAAVAIAGAALVAIRLVAPPSRLIVGPEAIPMTQILQTVAASAAVAVGLASLGWASTDPRIGRWLRIAAAVMTVYVVSVLAIDIVGLRVGPGTDLDELQTQGQVVLSVLWAILGVGALVYGIRADVREARQGGLLLLALATAKVFLFDLAALDVAYRVISLIALGLLLLMSAWFWQRAQPEQESGPP